MILTEIITDTKLSYNLMALIAANNQSVRIDEDNTMQFYDYNRPKNDGEYFIDRYKQLYKLIKDGISPTSIIVPKDWKERVTIMNEKRALN